MEDIRQTYKVDRINILLVDDNHRNLDVLCTILNNSEYNLVTANSGAEALGHLLKQRFAVIVLDIMMPEMDGFEVARLIKSRKKIEGTPIIFLTAFHSDERDIVRGYGLGACDYLVKPVQPELIRAKVAVFANLFRKSEAERRRFRHLNALANIKTDNNEERVNDGVTAMWVTDYRDLLLAHVRAMRLKQASPTDKIDQIAVTLVRSRLKTQDIVRLHISTVKSIEKHLIPSEMETFGVDARLCLLELMGRILDLYEAFSGKT